MRFLPAIAVLAMLAVASTPVAASAATLRTTIAVGSIDATTLLSTNARPTLSGIAFGVQTLELSIRDSERGRIIYTSKEIPVVDDRWEATIEERMADGVYTVELRTIEGFNFIVTPIGTLTVSTRAADTTLAVAPITLLSGGVATAGASVPISYLQVTNTSNSPAILQGFWVQQNGSASTAAVIGLMTIDDKGSLTGFSLGSIGAPLFAGNRGFAPAAATLAPGERRLFTVRALLAPDIASHRGAQLMLNIAAVETTGAVRGSFPIRGTTWTIK